MDLSGITVANTLVPILLIVLGALSTLAATMYLRRQDALKEIEKIRKEASDELQRRMAEMETQMRVMKESVQPISMAFQQILIKELTHFHEVRTDELLAKIGPPYMLTSAEEQELMAALEKRIAEAGEMMPDSELDAAKMLPMVTKRVKAELAMGIPAALKLVAVPEEPIGK